MTKPSPSKASWGPDSWRSYPIRQAPVYADKKALEKVEKKLRERPPLVFAGEARRLREELAKASKGEAFFLQGGDCAESFQDFSADQIRDSLQVLLQMAVVLVFGSSRPVIKAGRIAGQFAKPRSQEEETIEGKTLPSYRGDIINKIDFAPQARQPDPSRMLRAYDQSAATLNLLRAFTSGGFANLHHVHSWSLGFLKKSRYGKRYEELARQIQNALGFMEACGLTSERVREIRETDFYTCHELLLLPYERALTRQDSLDGKWYDCSAHMLWIGERTKSPDEAHVEFARGIHNPIGVKIGASTTVETVLRLSETLNQRNDPGRLTMIFRMGKDAVEKALPPLLRAVKREGISAVLSCDPMHGNTIRSANGYKTRKFDHILSECKSFFAANEAEGTIPGGVHFEMTGANVTECLGGVSDITEEDLHSRYHTHCDPRLNASQALEMAFALSEELQKDRS